MATNYKFSSPMLAKLTEDYFDNIDWIYEQKLDGERVLAFKSGSDVRLVSRNNKTLNKSYPELVEAIKGEKKDFVVDGEVVAFSDGKSDFSKLQNRMHLSDEAKIKSTGTKVYYYLFDILHLGNKNVEKLSQIERKKILKQSLSFHEPVRYLPHIAGSGVKYHREACRKGWEGIIAKDGKASYVHSRSSSWLKFKCTAEQELVIAGFTEPQGSRAGFGALLLGFYRKGKLVYAGKVGTGFDENELKSMTKSFKNLEVKKNQFDEGYKSESGAHFISPRLVAQIGFTEWTSDDKLRHPRFLGLRRDKSAKSVVKESR